MTNSKWVGGLVLLTGLLSFGCSGSDSGSGKCAAVSACGGDITGTWTISSLCANLPDLTETESCGAVKVHSGSASGTGTITFNSDGTESQDVAITIDETATFPTSCVSSADQCSAAAAQADAQPGASDASCSFSSGGCVCSFKATVPNAAGGTYQTSGTSLMLQDTGEDAETDPYCVSGNTLTIQTRDGDGNAVSITATK